jgi:hypothetical protein
MERYDPEALEMRSNNLITCVMSWVRQIRRIVFGLVTLGGDRTVAPGPGSFLRGQHRYLGGRTTWDQDPSFGTRTIGLGLGPSGPRTFPLDPGPFAWGQDHYSGVGTPGPTVALQLPSKVPFGSLQRHH